MKEALKQVKRILSCNSLSLLLFELGYRIGGFVLFYPLASYALNWSLHRMGYSNITNRNILNYLGDPWTLLILLFCLLFFLLIFIVEICSLLTCFEYSRHSMKIRASEMLLCGLKKAGRLLRGQHIKSFFWAFWLLPLLYLPFFLLLVSHHQLLLYLFEMLFAEKVRIVLFAVFAILLFAVSALLIFLLPHYLLEQKPDSKTALSLSIRHYPRILCYLLVWNLLLVLLTTIIFFFLIMGGILYSQLFVRADIKLAFLLGWKDRCITAILVFTFLAGALNNLGLFYVLYVHYREREAGRGYLYEQFQNEKERLRKRSVRLTGILMVSVLVIEAILLLIVFQFRFVSIPNSFVETTVTAHRGGLQTYPENTLAALQESIDSMTEYAEIDVQETADGVVILMHDLSLKRTTGISNYVYNLTYSDIIQQASELYTGDNYNMEYVPTLASVLELCDGKIKLNIDVKSNKYYDDTIIAKVVSLIETYSSPGQCIISSTNYHYLEEVKELNPDIRTGYIMKVAYGDLRDFDAIDFVSVKYSCVTEQLVESAHENGKEIHVWTVNSRNAINRMKGLGVDNIITDNPALAREILARQDNKIGFLELFELFVKD